MRSLDNDKKIELFRKDHPSIFTKCAVCNGTGVLYIGRLYNDHFKNFVFCTRCASTGLKLDEEKIKNSAEFGPCNECWGSGVITNPSNENLICRKCSGYGIVDWVTYIRS